MCLGMPWHLAGPGHPQAQDLLHMHETGTIKFIRFVTNWTEFVRWDSLVPGTGQCQATVMPTVTCLMRVHVCVLCEWWSGPCMCDRSLLNLCYLCQLWCQKPWDLSNVTHQWYLQCLLQLCAVT